MADVTDGADGTDVRALSGRAVDSLTVEAVRAGEVGVADLRIHPDTLEHQAVVAAEHGNPQLAENLRRAAELTRLPDEEVLAVYEALRPGRSTPAQLTELAASLAAPGPAPLRGAGDRGGGRLRPPGPFRLREADRVTVIAGVDVGNATTEVVLVSDGEILGAGRVPTRGRKGSAASLRGAAALVRRLERQLGCAVGEVRIAPLRAVDTSVLTVPDAAAPAGLRVLAAGVPTPGGTGACVGPPLSLADPGPRDGPVVAVVPPGLRYDEAAARLRALLAAGTRIGAVLVAGDEGVLIANRLPGGLPVIDQVDADAAAACQLLAVEVRPPGHTLRLLADPVALGARFGLRADEAGDAAAIGRALADHANAVVGLLAAPATPEVPAEPWVMTAERLPAAAGRVRAAGRLAGRRRTGVRFRGRVRRGRGR